MKPLKIPNFDYVEIWQEIRAEGLRRLIVDDDRREWILGRYPPSDMGRPLLFAPRDTSDASRQTTVSEIEPELVCD